MQFAPPPSRRQLTFQILGLVLWPCLLVGCSDPMFVLSGQALPRNFHELDAAKAYRCAQPTGDELKEAINLLNLKTVINLRGAHPGVAWYDEEAAACQDMNVTLANFAMGSSLPEPDLLKGIINALKTAEYPILIHCQGGADRTGAISAIYRMLIAGDARADALDELSIRYGHLRTKYPMMDALAQMYEPTDAWLDYYTQNYDNITKGLSQ